MQDIKITTCRTCYPPGSDAIIPLSFGVELDIDIIILLIEEPEVADRAGIDKEVFYVRYSQVFTTFDKAYLMQQVIEGGEFFCKAPAAGRVLSRFNEQGARNDTTVILQKGELRMIAQFLREYPWSHPGIEFE